MTWLIATMNFRRSLALSDRHGCGLRYSLAMEPATGPEFDVAIAGGGPAGLAGALVLGRMRRRVVLFDADDPAHGVSEGVHGFFGHDGIAPLELRRLGREQLRRYESVTVRMVAVDAVRQTPGGFVVLAGGTPSEAGVVLLCTGARYEPPQIEGAAAVWARGVYDCPYCHGWEVRDRPLAAYGPDSVGYALMLTSLSDDVVLLTDGSELEPADAALLRSAGVVVRDDPVARLEAEGGKLARIVFVDGSTDERAGLFFMPSLLRSPLAAELGCKLDESGAIVTDEDGRTSVAGVFAAGDAAAGKKAVVLAAAAGSRAAYAINAGLARGLFPVAGLSRTTA
jgi:thioredoxin reductase